MTGSPELSNTAAQDPAPLTAELVLRLGGWNSRHATVRAIEVVRDVGIALVDSNSDDREIEQEHLRWDTGHWRSSSSSGPTSERVGVSCIGEHIYNWDRDLHYRYAIGRARTPGPASYTLFGKPVTVTANQDRWWIHIQLPEPTDTPWAPLDPEQANAELRQ